MKPTLTWWGVFQTNRLRESASTRRGQLSVAVSTVRLNRTSHLLCQKLSQCWLNKISKVFSNKKHPSRGAPNMGRSTVTCGFSKKYIFIIFRSSCRQMFFKTGVIGNFAIFTGKHLCWSLFLIKLRALGLQLYFNLVPKETSTQVFSCENCEHLFL